MKKKTDLTTLQQGQQNKLNTLPNVILPGISSFLNKYDQSALVSSSKTIYGFLQPSRRLASLLRFVVTGNQDKVIQILRRYPQLMVSQGRVTDNSGRTFLKASAAELVRWCGDLRYMATEMLDILKNLPNQLLAEEIKANWVALDEAYDLNGGLEFVLPGGTQPTKSFAFSLAPLLNAMQVSIDSMNTPMTWPERDAQWCTKVGAEQFLLPAYYLQHYCNPAVPFLPTPSFDAPTFPRSLVIVNHKTRAIQSVWGHGKTGGILGRDYGIIREMGLRCAGGGAAEMSGLCEVDLFALRACEERIFLDRLDFRQMLREPLNPQASYCSIS